MAETMGCCWAPLLQWNVLLAVASWYSILFAKTHNFACSLHGNAKQATRKRSASTYALAAKILHLLFQTSGIIGMEGLASVHDIHALSALLSNPNDDDEEDDIQKAKPMARMGPGHIGSTAAPSRNNNKEGSTTYVKKNSKDIWAEDEVAEGAHFDDLTDPRPQPEYEIVLKQSVGTEDLFLGLSRKDPSSMCCDSMLIRVKLPGTKTSDLVLDVRETFLDLRTPKYKLGLHLPHPVHKEEGNARYIMEREELEITLPINRPTDCINLS